jgi:signal peptidase I
MSNPGEPPNPYAVGSSAAGAPARDPALSADPPTPAPRWLAVLIAFLSGNSLLGLGHVVLGRPRRFLRWLSIGLPLTLLLIVAVRLGWSRLYLALLPVGVVTWVWAMVDVGRATPAVMMPKHKAGYLAAGVAVFAVVSSLALRHWITQAFQMPADSMMPTLMPGDHFMVAKTRSVARGEVVAFGYPADPEVHYVKRVLGLGGDVVEVRDDVIHLNGQALPQAKLDEPCPPHPQLVAEGCVVLEERSGARHYRIVHDAHPPSSFGPATVPPGHVFVMGDNRHNSNDSRMWGTVPGDLVDGRAQFLIWSSQFARIGRSGE